MTIKVAKMMKRPFSSAQRIWTDYRVGRAIRKLKERSEQLDFQENKDKDCEEKMVKEHPIPPKPTTEHPPAPQHTASRPSPSPREGPEGWQLDRAAEFPWCYRQVIHEEGNWRGTWTLEVKDMGAMDWGTERVPNESGRGGKWRRRPTKQFPFGTGGEGPGIVLAEGGQDDLMVWSGKA